MDTDIRVVMERDTTEEPYFIRSAQITEMMVVRPFGKIRKTVYIDGIPYGGEEGIAECGIRAKTNKGRLKCVFGKNWKEM